MWRDPGVICVTSCVLLFVALLSNLIMIFLEIRCVFLFNAIQGSYVFHLVIINVCMNYLGHEI